MSGESADQIRQLRDQVKSVEREAASERKAASAAIGEAIDRAAETTENAAQRVNAKYETAAETIRAHPFAAILSAAAVGFILARAVR